MSNDVFKPETEKDEIPPASPEEFLEALERADVYPAVSIEGTPLPPECRIVVYTDPRSAGADRFRLVQIRLRSMQASRKLQSVLITSPLPEDGKSTVALNLATGLSDNGKCPVLLLEADVHYSVVKDFTARVRQRAVGIEVSKALNPAQQVIKIVNEELIATLGEPARLNLSGPKPRLIMMVGLQGSGKTTAAAKLARLLRGQGERVLLVAADPYRPAAIKQLQTLGDQVGVPVYTETDVKPPDVVAHAFSSGEKGGVTVLIVDTAGRSQIDQTLMDELHAISKRVPASEVLLVVDAMVGQEALHIAEGFRDSVSLTGLIMTKMDGDARGGAAISIRSVTGVPIKYLGVGEGVDALEAYDPGRLSSRILGMGDILGLIEKAESAYDEKLARNRLNACFRVSSPWKISPTSFARFEKWALSRRSSICCQAVWGRWRARWTRKMPRIN